MSLSFVSLSRVSLSCVSLSFVSRPFACSSLESCLEQVFKVLCVVFRIHCWFFWVPLCTNERDLSHALRRTMEVVTISALISRSAVYPLLDVLPTYTLCCERVEQQLKCVHDYMEAVNPFDLPDDDRFSAETCVHLLLLNTAVCARRLHFSRMYVQPVPTCACDLKSLSVRRWNKQLLDPFEEWCQFTKKLLTGLAQAMRSFRCPKAAFERLLRHPTLEKVGRCNNTGCGCPAKGDSTVSVHDLVKEGVKIRKSFGSPAVNWNHLFYRPSRTSRVNKCCRRRGRRCDCCAYRNPKACRVNRRRKANLGPSANTVVDRK